MTRARVAFLGMDSAFSVRALSALVSHGVDVALVLRPIGGIDTRRTPTLVKDDPGLALRGPMKRFSAGTSLSEAARHFGIPSFAVGDASHADVIALLRTRRVDGAVIAFFNQLLRPTFLNALQLGAVNAHPSLLPTLRGPAPLFWTFHAGAEVGGLSIHIVAPGEDDGAVLHQESVAIPFGMSGESFVQSLVERIEIAMPIVVDEWLSGEASPVLQIETDATHAPRPSADDRLIRAEMGARRIFQFVRGFGRFQVLEIVIDGVRQRVMDAVDFDPESRVPGDHIVVGNTLILATPSGMVALRLDAAGES